LKNIKGLKWQTWTQLEKEKRIKTGARGGVKKGRGRRGGQERRVHPKKEAEESGEKTREGFGSNIFVRTSSKT